MENLFRINQMKVDSCYGLLQLSRLRYDWKKKPKKKLVTTESRGKTKQTQRPTKHNTGRHTR